MSFHLGELRHALSISRPKLIFAATAHIKKIKDACSGMKNVQKIVDIEGFHISEFITCLKDFIKKYSNNDFDLENYIKKTVDIYNQPATIMLSSGTTGIPKGVITTQSNYMTLHVSFKERLEVVQHLSKQDCITALNIAPWFHVIGFVAMYLFACSRSHTISFLNRFDEQLFYQCIEKYKISYLMAVPPIMVMLAKSPLFDNYDLSSVKLITCGAAPLTTDTEEQVKKRFKNGLAIHQGYGLSETTHGVVGVLRKVKPGSVGEPYPGVYVKVIDENGVPLGPNKQGEICFKGDRIMKGYVDDEKATSETIDKDGWLHSGDIGYYDEDRQFFIVDRLKELIKYNGFQVAPAELEGIILSHPKVKDCGVIGIFDENSGELPFAFVVKQPGVDMRSDEIIKHVQNNVSKTKWLHGGVKFVDSIPKNPSGKILRKDMRKMYKNLKSKL